MNKFTKYLMAFTASVILAGGAYIAVDKIVDTITTQNPAGKPPADDPITVTYKATFIYGDIEKIQNVVAGEYPKFEAFVNDGTSRLIGWYIDNEDELVDPWTYPMTQDTIFIAKFEKPVNITFEGSADVQQVYPGEKIQKPADPVKEGYNFVGWSLDGINIVDFNSVEITGDTVFVALFEKATTSASLFSFDENGNVTGYTGEETEISIPKTYSLGEVETVTNTYSSYTTLNSSEKTYPYTITDSNDITFEITSFFDLSINPSVIAWPATVTKNVQKYVDGRDYQVTGIKANAFKSNTTLTSVVIPEGVTTIASNAFNGCTALTSVEVPDTVTSISATSFNGCSNFTFNKTSETDAGNYVGNKNNPYVALLSFDSKDFTTFTIPESCKYIVSSAFNACTVLTSISIPEGITIIESSTFKGCSALTSVTLPSTLITINSYAFQNCSALEGITIPDSVTTIGTYLFDGCSALTSVTLPSTLTEIPGYTFQNCSALTSILIPEGVTKFGHNVFRGCSVLATVNIPEGVTELGSNVFYECQKLTEINLPSTLTSVGSNCFSYCKITSITIPDNLTNIGLYAFDHLSYLKTLHLGAGITSMSAFQYCSGTLTKVYLNCDQVPTITAWSNTATKFYVKDVLYDTYIATEGWSDISTQIYRQSEE